MSLRVQDLNLLDNGNVRLTVSDGTNSASFVMDSAMLLEVMKIDLSKLTRMERLAKDAKVFALSIEALGNADSRVVVSAKAWLRNYFAWGGK